MFRSLYFVAMDSELILKSCGYSLNSQENFWYPPEVSPESLSKVSCIFRETLLYILTAMTPAEAEPLVSGYEACVQDFTEPFCFYLSFSGNSFVSYDGIEDPGF